VRILHVHLHLSHLADALIQSDLHWCLLVKTTGPRCEDILVFTLGCNVLWVSVNVSKVDPGTSGCLLWVVVYCGAVLT
jgi:hypothetical protein